MSKLGSLKQLIESIPEKQSASKSLAVLKRQSDIIKRLRDEYENAVRTLEILENVDGLHLSVERQRLQTLARTARPINEQFGDFENFDWRAYDTWLSKHKDAPAQVILKLKSYWSEHVANSLQKYRSILAIAKNARLSGAEAMSNEVISIETDYMAVPKTVNEAKTFEKRVSEFPKYIASLGLSLKVEEFLQAASRGGADPSLLYDEEIKVFLQANPALFSQMRLKI